MAKNLVGFLVVVVLLILGFVGYLRYATPEARVAHAADAGTSTPRVQAASPEQAGRYLIEIGGCNDCHTPGFMEKGNAIPESEWLTGLALGFRGPWGTTYPNNLRLSVQNVSEEAWTSAMRLRDRRPPMPWPSLHALSDPDFRAIYRYLKKLGPKGGPAPAALGPDQEPTTPYISMVPTTAKPAGQAASQ